MHSSPRHPSTNGIVERMHQYIIKSLISLKLKEKIYCICRKSSKFLLHNVTKEIPKKLFNNMNKYLNTYAKRNIIESQKKINSKNIKIPIN